MIQFCPRCATPVEERPFEGRLRPTCSACGYIHFADPKVAATLLVERAGKLLFVRRAIDPGRGKWCFPGGYVDFGEDPTAAAARECREEAGLEVRDIALLDVSFDGRVIVITYRAHAPGSAEPAPSDDADAAAWFGPDELPPLAFASMRRPIELWSEGSTQRRKDAKEHIDEN